MADEGNQFIKDFGAGAIDNPVSAPDYVKQEGARILEELRKTKPANLQDPNRLRDPRVVVAQDTRAMEWNSRVERFPKQPPFPPAEETQSVEQTAAIFLNIAFQLTDASNIVGDTPNNRVKVFDGKINGDYPIGMGFGNYILDLSNPEDAIIYAGITFNPTTLVITSRFLGESTASAFPESRVESATEGFIYWQLGFTFFDGNGTFTVWQTMLGNIDFELVYGSFNGRPALLPVTTQPGWLDLDDIIP